MVFFKEGLVELENTKGCFDSQPKFSCIFFQFVAILSTAQDSRYCLEKQSCEQVKNLAANCKPGAHCPTL